MKELAQEERIRCQQELNDIKVRRAFDSEI
jgi:hypothetical protein